jgi:hypothetical protein
MNILRPAGYVINSAKPLRKCHMKMHCALYSHNPISGWKQGLVHGADCACHLSLRKWMACRLGRPCLFSDSPRDAYFFSPFKLVFRSDRGVVLTPTPCPLPSSSEMRNAWIYPLIFCRNNVICSLHDSGELNMIEEGMTSDFRKKSDTRHDCKYVQELKKTFRQK